MKKISLSFFLLFCINMAWGQLVNKPLWANAIGSPKTDIVNAITVDDSGYVYLTGSFTDRADFDPGPGTFTLDATIDITAPDIFVAKYDKAGALLWARSMGSIASERGTAIAVDTAGNVYVSGMFTSTIDFDPGPGVYNITSSTLGRFLLKLDRNGGFQWAHKFGNGDSRPGNDILKLDDSGNVYMAGQYNGLMDFDPGPGTFNLSTINGNCFLLKLSPSGAFMMAKDFGGSLGRPKAIQIAKSGSIYVVGNFFFVADFDPGSGVYNLTEGGTSSTGTNVFMAKYDRNGALVWAKGIGSPNLEDTSVSCALDAHNNLYIVGGIDKPFSDSVDFDPGPGKYNLRPESSDGFLMKLDSNGNFRNAYTYNLSYTYLNQVVADKFGKIYVGGTFQDPTFPLDFDFGAGKFEIMAKTRKVFMQVMDTAMNFITAFEVTSGLAQAYGGSVAADRFGNFYSTGTFANTEDFDPSAAVKNLKASGAAGIYDIFFCKYRTCPSLTSSLSAKSCRSYFFEGTTYTSSGIYNHVFTLADGCDSNVTLNLDIVNSDKTVTVTGSNVSSNETAATYQWVECPSYTIIPSATSRTFTLSKAGNYAVIMLKDGCVDTSGCYAATPTGILETKSTINAVSISPNPAYDFVQVAISGMTTNARVDLYNIMGEQLFSIPAKSSLVLDLSAYPSGMYLLKLYGEGYAPSIQKIIKR